jgi:hypothetical protein
MDTWPNSLLAFRQDDLRTAASAGRRVHSQANAIRRMQKWLC